MDDELDRFRAAYGRPEGGVLAEIEQAVIGATFGANGYTTREQADLIGSRLGLGPDDLLLDVGTGCGWPGTYLADTTGCRVVATDVPLEGLWRARHRLAGASRHRTLGLVANTAEALPFASERFDAICSTDVLC